jgi:hypothetical protein
MTGFLKGIFTLKLRLPVCLLAALSIAPTLLAADRVHQGFVNLGETSFMDGVAGPGKLFQVAGSSFTAERLKDSNNDSLPGDNHVDINGVLLQWVDLTEHKIGSAYYGWELLLPVADIDPDTDIPGFNEGERGMGDLIFSPFILQWTDNTLFGKPYFHRFNLILMAPTGDYDKDNQVSTGTNTWRFNPYYAGTVMLTSKWAVSFRLHYLWNEKNDDPNPLIANEDTQAGELFHMNWTTSYEVAPGLRLGLGGYYLNQLSSDRIDGHSQPDSKEKVYSIGPGLVWRREGGMLNINSYFEFGAENRPQGHKLVIRYAWLFH